MTLTQKRFLIILVNIIISSLFFFALPENYRQNESTDYIGYYGPVAENIANNRDLLENISFGTYRYPIGFPLILSFVFKCSQILNISQEISIKLFSIFCFIISALLIFEIYKIYLGEKLGLLASFIFSTYPIVLWTIKQPNSETPFIPLLYLALLIFFKLDIKSKWTHYFLLGVITGITALIRPITLFLPIVFSLIVLYKGYKNNLKNFLPVFMICLGAFLAILPWESYMYIKQHKILLLSSGGAPSIYDGLTFNSNLKNYRTKIPMPEDVQNVMENVFKNTPDMNDSKQIKANILIEVKSNPIAVLKLYVIKFFRTFYATDSLRNEKIIIVIQILYFILSLLGIKTLLKSGVIARDEILSIIIILIYFCLMSTMVLSIARYTAPIIGAMIPVIAGIFYKKKEISNQ